MRSLRSRPSLSTVACTRKLAPRAPEHIQNKRATACANTLTALQRRLAQAVLPVPRVRVLRFARAPFHTRFARAPPSRPRAHTYTTPNSQYQDVLLLRRVYDDAVGHFGPMFWAAPAIPPGFAEASARHNVTALPQQDAQTRGDISTLTPAATDPPCATVSTSKCEFCRGGCQDWAVPLNVTSLENERSHWRVPGSDADVLLYRSHNRVLYASVRTSVGGAWPTPVPTNITDDVANFNAGNFPSTAGLDGRPFLVSVRLAAPRPPHPNTPERTLTPPPGDPFTLIERDDHVFAGPPVPQHRTRRLRLHNHPRHWLLRRQRRVCVAHAALVCFRSRPAGPRPRLRPKSSPAN